MIEYYILTRDPMFITVGKWLAHNRIPCEVHLNRTRFKLEANSRLHTEFQLRFSHCCARVLDTDNY